MSVTDLAVPRLDALGPPDVVLIASAADGNEDAFAALVRRHQGRIFRLCRSVTLNREDAEDLSQESFFRLHRHLHRYRPEVKLSTWLHTIALNLCRNHLRRRRLIRFLGLEQAAEPADPGRGPADSADARQQESQMAVWLGELPPRLRIPFSLRYLDERSDPEIAGLLGLTVNAVRVRIHRARQALERRAAAAERTM